MDMNEYQIMYDLEKSYWWFKGKQYLVKSFLRKFRDVLHNDDKVLDIGCGTGMVLETLNRQANGYGLDYSSHSLFFLKKRGLRNIICSDLTDPIPFKNDSFNAVVCLDLLEHIDDDLSLIKEIKRIVMPGGHILITVPAYKTLWSPHDEALHHRRRYGIAELLNKVKGAGYKTLKASYFNSCLLLPILVLRKVNSLLGDRREPKTDFNIKIPECINRLLEYLLTAEIFLMRFINYPFGVSILLILQKDTEDR